MSLEDFRRKVARCRTHWVISKRNDLPTTLCTTLDSVNPVLYPSIDTILIKLCVLLTMPVASATAEMSFSVLRRLKTYVRSTMKNDRLSSLGLMHINRDFEVDLYKAMEVFASTGTRIPDPFFLIWSLPRLWYGSLSGSISLNHLSIFYIALFSCQHSSKITNVTFLKQSKNPRP